MATWNANVDYSDEAEKLFAAGDRMGAYQKIFGSEDSRAAKLADTGNDYGMTNEQLWTSLAAKYPRSSQNDLTDYLRQSQAAATEAELAGLKGAYEQSMLEYNNRLKRLPQAYTAAKNEAAAQNALGRQAFNERAAASGLNSGASGQAALTSNAVLQGNLAGINQQQANAESDIELEKARVQAQYNNAIAQARANGNAALATALYNELIRLQGLDREDEQMYYSRSLDEYNKQLAADQRDYERAQDEWTRRYQLALVGAQYGDYSGLQELGINPNIMPTYGYSGGGGGGGGGGNTTTPATEPVTESSGSALYRQLYQAISNPNVTYSRGTMEDAIYNANITPEEKNALLYVMEQRLSGQTADAANAQAAQQSADQWALYNELKSNLETGKYSAGTAKDAIYNADIADWQKEELAGIWNRLYPAG